MAIRVDDVDLIRDAALVERFQAGDTNAFDELYRRYFRRLERFCQRRVGDSAEAEEVAQEAFARAYHAMPRLAGERRFYPWVSVIAARLCVDSHRRRGRTEPTAEIDPGTTEGGMDEILHAVDVAALQDAMARLAPRHREVLELREHEGWSYQRIADHYGVTMGTVEALLFRARKALRREFMIVTGGDADRGDTRGGRILHALGGAPLIGVVVRYLAGAKAKAAAGGGVHVATTLASVASVAMLVGGTVAVLPHTHSPKAAAGVTVRTMAPAVAAHTTQAATAPAAAAPEATAAAPQASAPAHAAAPGAKAADPAKKAPVAILGDPKQAQDCVQQCEVRGGTLGLGIGANPTAIVDDTVNGVAQTVDHLGKALSK